MSTERPRTKLTIDRELLNRIEDYTFENRVNSRSEAMRQIIEEALKKNERKPKK